MTRILEAEVAMPAGCDLGEGPVWDVRRGLLRWVDILAAQPHAGDVFACTPGVPGRAPFLFGA